MKNTLFTETTSFPFYAIAKNSNMAYAQLSPYDLLQTACYPLSRIKSFNKNVKLSLSISANGEIKDVLEQDWAIDDSVTPDVHLAAYIAELKSLMHGHEKSPDSISKGIAELIEDNQIKSSNDIFKLDVELTIKMFEVI